VCNLVDDPWIPLNPLDGVTKEFSLLEALLDSDRFKAPAFPAPTLFPAVLRQVLLPVLLDSIGAPATEQEWAARFSRGRFSDAEKETIRAYLTRHHDLFDLFSPERPFGQVADLSTAKNETKSSALLVPAIATGNNVPVFSTLTEADTLSLRLAEAVWWLLHTQCWDTAAIKTGAVGDPNAKQGKTTGNPTGPLGQLGVIVPTGDTLFATLMLNLPPGPAPRAEDRPQWRAPALGEAGPEGVASPRSPQWSIRPELGLMDLLTWQSRRIRLFTTDTSEGPRVTRVLVCAGDRLVQIPESEPHTAWTWIAKPRKGQPRWRPRRHRARRAIWRGLESLLAVVPPDERGSSTDVEVTSTLLRALHDLRVDGDLPETYPLRLLVVGMVYGNQSAVVEDSLDDEIPLPVSALVVDDRTREAVIDIGRHSDALITALDRLDQDLRRAAGGDPLPWDKGSHPGAVLSHDLAPLAKSALALIQQHSDDPDELERVMRFWEQHSGDLAELHGRHLLEAAPPQVFARRETGDRTYSAASAHRFFRSALNKNLTRRSERHLTSISERS
jgi:CRISPR system Cascade subunit CasA